MKITEGGQERGGDGDEEKHLSLSRMHGLYRERPKLRRRSGS